MKDGFGMKLFGSKHGETIVQVETHLITENTDGSGSCSIGFLHSMFKDVMK
jgi:hypothetical protein